MLSVVAAESTFIASRMKKVLVFAVAIGSPGVWLAYNVCDGPDRPINPANLDMWVHVRPPIPSCHAVAGMGLKSHGTLASRTSVRSLYKRKPTRLGCMKVVCRHCGCDWIVNAWDEVTIIRELDPCHVGSQGIHSLRGAI
jgi:hypothetical protein